MVPLNMNKLDLRDYLFHAYGVRVFSIRSFVKLSPIRSVEPGSERDLPGKRRHWRPKNTKKMMVQLEKPFVWPEEPTAEEMKKDFDNERWQQMEEHRSRVMKAEPNVMRQNKERLSIAEQAQRLLEGKDRWKDVDPSVPSAPTTGRWSLPLR